MIAAFWRLAETLRASAGIESVARAYLAFAKGSPAIYDAMFTLPAGLTFAEEASRPELKEAFAALVAALPAGVWDSATATELFWVGLHGLASLERGHRLRPEAGEARLARLIQALGASA